MTGKLSFIKINKILGRIFKQNQRFKYKHRYIYDEIKQIKKIVSKKYE